MIWLLSITLASAPHHSEYYEFQSLEDCMNAVSPVEVLYENLGDPAEVECVPGVDQGQKQESELFPSFESSSFKIQGVKFTF